MSSYTRYKIQDTRYNAFTLLELLIVIAITAALSAVSVGFYVNQQKAKILENTAQEIANYLRYAQQKSMAQEQSLQWGVHFDNPTSGDDFYALYTGTTYSTPIETKYLPTGIVFTTPATGNSVNVSFNKLTGTNYSGAEQELIIRLTSNQVARVIRTMSNGLVVISEGEKGYWKFDEGSGTTAYDSTIYKNNGTLTNGPTWQSASNCVSGSCLSFDGSSNYVDCGNATSLNVTTVFTYEAWVKRLGGFGSIQNIIAKNSLGSNINSAPTWYFDANNKVSFVVQGVALIGGGNTAITDTAWHHLVITRDSANNWKWYLDGNSDGLVVSSYTPTSNNGNLYIATGFGGYYFNGLIDEVRIYNRALSPAEILQHYNSRS